MEESKLALGQRIKVKSNYPLYFPFNREGGVIVGFAEQGKVQVKPDRDQSRILELYPHEIRDTQQSSQEIPPRAHLPFT